jgi:hypothetical protein
LDALGDRDIVELARRPVHELAGELGDLRLIEAAALVCAHDFAALREGLQKGQIEALTYKHRLDNHDDGPNGVLVRDVLLNPDAYSSSEFVRILEIVEDICVAARSNLGFDLEPRFEGATTPCVVEFAAPPRNADKALTAACWYAEAALRGKTAAGDDAFFNFDGHGMAVPLEDIVSVDADVRV